MGLNEKLHVVYFDRSSGRPYCVLLQAILPGAANSHIVSSMFDNWIIDFTGKCVPVKGTMKDFKAFAKHSEKERAEILKEMYPCT